MPFEGIIVDKQKAKESRKRPNKKLSVNKNKKSKLIQLETDQDAINESAIMEEAKPGLSQPPKHQEHSNLARSAKMLELLTEHTAPTPSFATLPMIPLPMMATPPRVSKYQRGSPKYVPASPPSNPNICCWQPKSPQYAPTSPVYNPTSPLYKTSAANYAPTSPTYNPTSPLCFPYEAYI